MPVYVWDEIIRWLVFIVVCLIIGSLVGYFIVVGDINADAATHIIIDENQG